MLNVKQWLEYMLHYVDKVDKNINFHFFGFCP